MKKKLAGFFLCILLACSLLGCAKEEEIGKNSVKTNTEAGKQDTNKTDKQEILKGYIFEAEGISMTTDIDVTEIVEKLGEPVSYFEAASCAFQGMDKIYTYAHFEIDTYPDGDTDKILSIIFLDDMVSTQEGVRIGMTKQDMEQIYGIDYEKQNEFYIYTKDNRKLTFMIENEKITSIAYDSEVLNR